MYHRINIQLPLQPSANNTQIQEARGLQHKSQELIPASFQLAANEG